MKKAIFSIARIDKSIVELVGQTGKKTLALWAIDCAERVLPYFEKRFPEDRRPRNAIATLRTWIETGIFRMADIRRAALASHAAAREVNEDNAARSAARAAGQAVATAHVPAHSVAAANYALQAIHRAASSYDADAAVARERDWQYQRLLALRKSKRFGSAHSKVRVK